MLKRFARWVLRQELADLRTALLEAEEDAGFLRARYFRGQARSAQLQRELDLYRTVQLNPTSEGIIG